MVPVELKSEKLTRRRTSITIMFIVSAFMLANCKHEPKNASAESKTQGDPLLNDKCYAPTKQATPAEKDEWVKQLALAAQDAEKTSGVPASALVAMSVRESGFGTTRLYLGAANPYGYKWNASNSEGKPKWVLTCQPKADPGNEYVKFKNYWDATLFLGRKLSNIERYKAATNQYVKDRKNGVKVDTAVDRWVSAIAVAGYNYDPPAYKADIVTTMYNYRSPSWSKSKDYNLYWVSEAVMPRSSK